MPKVSAAVTGEGEAGPVWGTEPAGIGRITGLTIGVGGIPTMSAWGMIFMTLLVLTLGTLVYRRRGQAAG